MERTLERTLPVKTGSKRLKSMKNWKMKSKNFLWKYTERGGWGRDGLEEEQERKLNKYRDPSRSSNV